MLSSTVPYGAFASFRSAPVEAARFPRVVVGGSFEEEPGDQTEDDGP
jgi:hypothetical protein